MRKWQLLRLLFVVGIIPAIYGLGYFYVVSGFVDYCNGHIGPKYIKQATSKVETYNFIEILFTGIMMTGMLVAGLALLIFVLTIIRTIFKSLWSFIKYGPKKD